RCRRPPAGGPGHQPRPHPARAAEAGRVDLRPGRRGRRNPVWRGPQGQRRPGPGRRGRRPAPPDPRDLRWPGADPDAGRRGKPQRLRRGGRVPVRGGPPARRLRRGRQARSARVPSRQQGGWRARVACWAVLCLLLWLPAAAVPATAQPGPPPLRDYAVDAWTTRNGLLHNSVRDIAQTAEGYLWFATWEGVVRYNGVEFTAYNRGSTPGLRDNGVGALYLDPNRRLWLSDSRGNLGRLGDDGAWHYLERAPEWPRALVHDMAIDGQGRMWLLFEGHGLGCGLRDGRLAYIAPPPGIPLRASFQRMAIDAAGDIWIGTLEGLVRYTADGKWQRYGRADGFPQGLVWPYLAPDGTLWLAAGEQVFRRRPDGRFRLAHALPGAGYFTSMLQDREGQLWLGTENRGVARIGPRGLEWLPPESLTNGRIASLLEDAEGGIWIGANGGLFRLRETLFTSWTRRDGLGGDYVRAVLEDDAGTLWVGGSGGLDRLGAEGRFHAVALP